MENFSAKTYVLTLGQMLDNIQKVDAKNPDRKTWLIRKNLEFWVNMISYVPRLEI